MQILKYILAGFGILIVLFIGLIFTLGFMFSAGTHGSIKGYQYSVSKETLELAINEVIQEDTTIFYRPPVDTSNFTHNNDEYYNSDGYITLSIKAPEEYNYIFRFYGGEEYWKNSSNSEIFICIASDNLGNGGSEGLGGVEWYRWGVKKKLTNYFEKHFISKIDKKLGIKHQEKD